MCYMSDIEIYISIHAPTRGATKNATSKYYKGVISIHAPTRGATDGNLQCQLINAISIHAPTRGATLIGA